MPPAVTVPALALLLAVLADPGPTAPQSRALLPPRPSQACCFKLRCAHHSLRGHWHRLHSPRTGTGPRLSCVLCSQTRRPLPPQSRRLLRLFCLPCSHFALFKFLTALSHFSDEHWMRPRSESGPPACATLTLAAASTWAGQEQVHRRGGAAVCTLGSSSWSGQARNITRPKSEAMRVTRQLGLPPRYRRG